MPNTNIQQTIAILGSDYISCLKDIFLRLRGMPPQLPRDRYRADDPSKLDALDALEHTHQLIKSDETRAHYRLSPYSLPLIQTDRAEHLVQVMCDTFEIFKKLYKERLKERVFAREIVEKVEHPKQDVVEALYYMTETHSVWAGKSGGFPYEPESTIYIDEAVLKRDKFLDVLTDYYRWHFIDAKDIVSPENLSRLFGDSERSAPRFFSLKDSEKYPQWFESLGATEKALIIEIDKSLLAGLNALPVMGIRALVENTMLSFIEDKNSFRENLEEFCQQGYLTKQHKELLSSVIDAGHAVMHRAHIPTQNDVLACIEVVKHFMHGAFILKPQMDRLKENTPQRNKQSSVA